jgi:hypothetical protein
MISEEIEEYERRPDPKTEFIGKYKAFMSLIQVVAQLLFIYFFAKLWMNGRILFAYPLLLIPGLLLIAWIYFSKTPGYENLTFWGIIVACGTSELLRRVIFDSTYQLLLFSIPEKLSNALRMSARLFFKPVVIIMICAVLLILSVQTDLTQVYCYILIASLMVMAFAVYKIPGAFISSLKTSVKIRVPMERAVHSLVSLESKFINEQYRKVVAESDDRFGCLYLLIIIGKNYSPDLNFILAELLDHNDEKVRLETLLVINDLSITKLVGHVEERFEREKHMEIREAALKLVLSLGASDPSVVSRWIKLDLPPQLKKYIIAIAYQSRKPEHKRFAEEQIIYFLNSTVETEILSGIWLLGELRITLLKDRIITHFGVEDPDAFGVILSAAAKLKEFGLFTAYIDHIGYAKIPDYKILNQTLSVFGDRSFQMITGIMDSIIESKRYLELEKYLSALEFIPSQPAIRFLGDMFTQYNIPIVRKKALDCISGMKSANPNLDYARFVDRLSDEIDVCRKYCRYYHKVTSWNADSLMLIELARNIEYNMWNLFKILEMSYPNSAIIDSYYRITHTSRQHAKDAHAKAKSLEYLQNSALEEHESILNLLEAIIFEDGFFMDVAPLPGPPLEVEDILADIMTQGYYWLKVSALLDITPNIRKRFGMEETQDMIPVLEKIHFLKQVSLFTGFSIMEMIIVAQITKEVKFNTGHRLFHIGDPADALYLILDGRVNILNEKDQVLNTLTHPQSFGEIAVIDKAGRLAAAVCVEDSTMLMIPGDDFQEILEKYPILYKNINFILTKWLRESNWWSPEK